jgi:hypothetical protein
MRISITRIAGAAALVALGGLGATALNPQPGRPAIEAARPAPVEVRTQVIHRTIRIVRREKPKRPRPVAAPAPAPPTAKAAAVIAPPVTYAAPPPAPARTVAPLRTRTSGAGQGGSEHGDREREGRDD